jgi:flavin-dependent dehydrogenase
LDNGPTDYDYFRGKFPVSLGHGFYGNRFVVLGDAAGMIRPFKGKGVTAGCASGVNIAATMLTEGISERVFRDFFQQDVYCREIRRDVPYARVLRWLASSSANHGYLDHVIAFARTDERMSRALFDSVSAHRSYRDIVAETLSVGLVLKGMRAVAAGIIPHQGRHLLDD